MTEWIELTLFGSVCVLAGWFAHRFHVYDLIRRGKISVDHEQFIAQQERLRQQEREYVEGRAKNMAQRSSSA